jgi:ferritin-like metal-binding protein YciE
MTATTDVLIPALREVREAEAAIADRLRAHATVTPSDEYRETLERRIGDARGHVRRIDERLKTLQLQPRGLARTVFGGAVHLIGMAVRMPFEVAMGIPAALLRGKATQRQLLKNTEREYGITAFAVATCRAGEHIAQEIGDADSSDLLDSIRRDDEDLLERLGPTLKQRAEAVVAATTKGAVIAEDQLPIPGYGTLSTRQITDQLPQLAQTDLATIEEYERSHAGRFQILSKIGDLLEPPWP